MDAAQGAKPVGRGRAAGLPIVRPKRDGGEIWTTDRGMFFAVLTLYCGAHERCRGIVGYVLREGIKEAGWRWPPGGYHVFVRQRALPGDLRSQLHVGRAGTITTLPPMSDQAAERIEQADVLLRAERTDFPLRVMCPRCHRGSHMNYATPRKKEALIA